MLEQPSDTSLITIGLCYPSTFNSDNRSTPARHPFISVHEHAKHPLTHVRFVDTQRPNTSGSLPHPHPRPPSYSSGTQVREKVQPQHPRPSYRDHMFHLRPTRREARCTRAESPGPRAWYRGYGEIPSAQAFPPTPVPRSPVGSSGVSPRALVDFGYRARLHRVAASDHECRRARPRG